MLSILKSPDAVTFVRLRFPVVPLHVSLLQLKSISLRFPVVILTVTSPLHSIVLAVIFPVVAFIVKEFV